MRSLFRASARPENYCFESAARESGRHFFEEDLGISAAGSLLSYGVSRTLLSLHSILLKEGACCYAGGASEQILFMFVFFLESLMVLVRLIRLLSDTFFGAMEFED